MSAPATHDPLFVNTQDGAVWMRRAVTREGRGLYAVADAPKCCPEFVMATLSELAEHGIAGSADALPMPVGPDSEAAYEARRDRYAKALYEFVNGAFVWAACDDQDSWRAEADAAIAVADDELVGVNLSLYEEELENARLRLALKSAKRGRSRLRAQVAELLAERHSTNEALDDAVQALRADRAEPAKGPTPNESADRLTAFFAPVASLREDPHDSPLHHSYRVSHDLPEMGGAH